MITFNNFKKQYLCSKKEIDASIKEVLMSGQFILGERVSRFEKEFGDYLGAKYCIGVGNGFEAIKIALMVLGVAEGDEVITTSLSAAATALAIESVGARAIFADIDDFYNIDPIDVEKKITKRTKAILPVHLYGQAADIEELGRIAKNNSLFLIEDAAQAHGAEYRGKKLGTLGDFGCFSFYPTKNLGAFGDAGAIVTDNKMYCEECKKIRNYGQKNRYEHERFGINSRLDEIQAAILSVELKKLDSMNKKREENAELYRTLLKGTRQIELPASRKGATHIYHQFVIEAEKRNDLIAYLEKQGITALIHYPIPLHKQMCFSGSNKLSLPAVERAAGIIMSLPINPFLTKKNISFICQNIKNFYER